MSSSLGIRRGRCQRIPGHASRANGSRIAAAHAKKDGAPRLAIVGITGAVGQEFLRVRTSRMCQLSFARIKGLQIYTHLNV
jgi:hypothetical protein